MVGLVWQVDLVEDAADMRRWAEMGSARLMSKRWLDRSWVETRLFRALDLGDAAVMHDQLHDPEAKALDLCAQYCDPLGLGAGGGLVGLGFRFHDSAGQIEYSPRMW